MSERMKEIALHKEMLRSQMKASDTERQTVRYIARRDGGKIPQFFLRIAQEVNC